MFIYQQRKTIILYKHLIYIITQKSYNNQRRVNYAINEE